MRRMHIIWLIPTVVTVLTVFAKCRPCVSKKTFVLYIMYAILWAFLRCQDSRPWNFRQNFWWDNFEEHQCRIISTILINGPKRRKKWVLTFYQPIHENVESVMSLFPSLTCPKMPVRGHTDVRVLRGCKWTTCIGFCRRNKQTSLFVFTSVTY